MIWTLAWQGEGEHFPISYDLEKISEGVLTWEINLTTGNIRPHAIRAQQLSLICWQMFPVMNVLRPRSQPSLNGGFGQVWGEQWPFSESPQQTLPMKLVHHLELCQDHRQDAIDLTRKAPNSHGDREVEGRKKQRKGGIHGCR